MLGGARRACSATVEPYDLATLETAVHDYAESHGPKMGDVVNPLRVATTGQGVGPGLYDCLVILGRDVVPGADRRDPGDARRAGAGGLIAATGGIAVSKHRRNWLIAGVVVLIILAIESVSWLTAAPSATIEVVNDGGSTMYDVRLRCGDEVVAIARLEPKGVAVARFASRRPITASLKYKMTGSSIGEIVLEDFDPAELTRDAMKVRVEVQETGYRRYNEDDPHWTTMKWQAFQDWLRKSP